MYAKRSSLFLILWIAIGLLNGCATDPTVNGGGSDAPSNPGGGSEPASPDVPQPSAEALLDFSLSDVNASSPRYGEAISPRDYLGQVSGWYFGSAT